MRFFAIPLLAGLLAACGGGDGGGGGGGGASTPTTHLVTAIAQTGGTVSPAIVTVAPGATASVTVTAASGHTIATVVGCGGSLAGATYTTTNITGDCTIVATFGTLNFHVDVTGNARGGLVIENNGSERVAIDSDGRFTFASGIHVGTPYSVRVVQQPVAEICVVTNGDGVIGATNAIVVSVRCVNRVVSTPMLTLRTTVDSAGQPRQFLYFQPRNNDLHQLRIRAADGGLEQIAPTWTVGPFTQAFVFSADGSHVFADDIAGDIAAAIVRESDGAVIPAWTGVLGSYSPLLPVPFTPVRPSHDGLLLYRNNTPVVSGTRYDDLWVGTVSETGVSMVAGSPFALGSDAGVPNFDPSGRYFVRLLRNTRRLEVYRAITASAQQPELVYEGSQTLPGSASSTLFAEAAPGTYLYEVNFFRSMGSGTPIAQIALHAWQKDGSLLTLGWALDGTPSTEEIATEVCPAQVAFKSRTSYLEPLPFASARTSRYLLQRHDTSCSGGPFGTGLTDIRVLAVYLVSVANGQAALTKLPFDALPEWPDLGAGGWAHPTEPWLYIGSKYSQRIYAYAVDEAAGSVQPIAGSPFLVNPMPSGGELSVPALIMDPSGRFLYLARDSLTGTPSGYLAAFTIDPATGALTATETYSP